MSEGRWVVLDLTDGLGLAELYVALLGMLIATSTQGKLLAMTGLVVGTYTSWSVESMTQVLVAVRL